MNADIENLFPRLKASAYEATSPEDTNYNCIAWAAQDTQRKWWPDAMGIGFWPAGVVREETLRAFVSAYATLGFELCDSGEVEDGFEKVAIYTDAGGEPTHAARQLANGRWTSKLGDLQDIEHDLDAVEGNRYGRVGAFLKRPSRPRLGCLAGPLLLL
jgi:hypothetical protein